MCLALLVLLRSGEASLTIFISGPELSVCVEVCVCVGGGGGDYSPLSFIYRSPREEDCVTLWPLPTHAGARKIYISTITKSFSL